MGTEQNGQGVVIETRRLRLRSYRETDLLQLVSLINNWEVVHWVSMVPHPYTEAHGREWIASVQAEHARGKSRRFAVALKNTDCVVGGVGLDGSPGDDSPETALGYWLGQPYWETSTVAKPWPQLSGMGFTVSAFEQCAPLLIRPMQHPKRCC